MNMNINAIKYEFTQYLIETGQISGTEKPSSSEVNIFSYSSQFKDFLKKEGIIDKDLSSKNLSDILQMNIDDNGKFVGDEFEKHTESDEANSKNQEEDIFAQIYNELLDNKEFFNAMDSDGNGEISKDEQKLFLEIIENLDGNKDISIDDLLLVSDTIKDNKFNELKNLFINNDNNDNTALNNNSSGGISSSISSNPYVNNNVMPKEEKKSIENMSQPELESELESEQSSLQTNKDLLDSYVNGTGPGLDSYKEAMETAYSKYKTELESVAPELVQQMEQIETAISDKENEISAQEQAITLQEAKYTEACNTFDTISATVTSLTQLVQELQAIDREGLTPEQTSTIDANLKEAEKQLATATEKQGEALTNKETQNNLLTKEKEKLDTFYKGEDGLNSLNEAKQTLEETISKEQPQLTELMNKYNNAKTEYTTQKNSFISQAQKAVIDSQKRIGDINSALNNYDNKAKRRELSFNTLFSSDVDYTYEFINDGSTIPYLLIGPKDADPNQELPALVYLHGSGEIKAYDDKMVNGSNKNLLPYNLLANENNFENFNGYIICPVLGGEYGSNWRNENAVNYISNLLDTFSATHKINEDKVALAGHSLGGIGAEYIGYHLSSRFCSIGVLSGYNSGVDISQLDIPVYGFVGQGDSEYMTTTFAQRVGSDKLYIQKGVGHGGVPRSVFLTDSNGNGRSDFFEMLFGDI